MKKIFIIFTLIAGLFLPSLVAAEVIQADAVWEGEINLKEDVLIPPGVTVEVRPGTVIKVWPAENTKIDPEFLSHQTEILVRGTFNVSGSAGALVTIKLGGDDSEQRWAGLIVDGGQVKIEHCRIQGAETAGNIIKGSLEMKNVLLTENRYGIVAYGKGSQISLVDTDIQKNDYGVLAFNGAKVTRSGGTLKNNEKKDEHIGETQYVRVIPTVYQEREMPLTRVYKNETLRGNNTWSGKIRIEGQVRLSIEARLIILPGTVVEFTKRDTNGDGIGENGILVQGTFIAKGSAEHPIIFRSAESERGKGDWDSINILGSDQNRNLIEFCQIEDAYRGMHFHFANVAVTNTVLRKNYRGLQFQESLVEIRNSQFYWNNSAMQARDSQVIFKNNQVFNNINGANLYRMNFKANGNIFANNYWDGMRIREGATYIEQNSMVGNRFGLVVADAVFGKFGGNLLAGNLETGLVLRNNDHIDCSKNAIMANGINGISIKESRAVLSNNLIADNGERGIGITSFSGTITANNFSGNGLYAIGLDGPDNIDASGNWWGGADLQEKIFDRNDDPTLGLVDFSDQKANASLFSWPVPVVPVDLSWQGMVRVAGTVEVPEKVNLTVLPGSVVKFDGGAGLNVFGTIKALGGDSNRILFTSVAGKGAMDWNEISLDRALDSKFINCDFENATWAVHSHFSNLEINRCRFRNNDGGLRFRSGPMQIKSSIFTENRIGMRSFRGFGEVRDNVISRNEIGVFIREKGAGLTVNNNNLHTNERYNMRLGDFNDEDVNATNNWWGGVDVVETVFDGNRESYIGMVLFEPVLDAPIVPELEEWH
jgi:hypothetical protein